MLRHKGSCVLHQHFHILNKRLGICRFPSGKLDVDPDRCLLHFRVPHPHVADIYEQAQVKEASCYKTLAAANKAFVLIVNSLFI